MDQARRNRARQIVGDGAADWLACRESQVSDWHHRTLSPTGRRHRRFLNQFRDRHAGERCVILGNGPSLQQTDLSLLRSETTFGLNRIYLLFDDMGFETTYLACVNELVISQVFDEIAALTMPRFLRASTEHLFRPSPTLGYLRSRRGEGFSTDITDGVWEGATVTFVALQIAYFMGFRDVILVGVDHNFSTAGPANETVTSAGADPNHFHADYFGKGFRWQLPDLEASEIAYRRARRAFERAGGRVVDATVGGKLEVFDKVDLATELR